MLCACRLPTPRRTCGQRDLSRKPVTCSNPSANRGSQSQSAEHSQKLTTRIELPVDSVGTDVVGTVRHGHPERSNQALARLLPTTFDDQTASRRRSSKVVFRNLSFSMLRTLM